MIKNILIEALDPSEKSLSIEMMDLIQNIVRDCSLNEFDSISIGENKATYALTDLQFIAEFICALCAGSNRIEFNKRNIPPKEEE